MEPLKTLNGSKIWYSKFGVGKQVGSKIYIHTSVWDQVIPVDIWNKAFQIMTNKYYFSPGLFNTVCYDLKKPSLIRFDLCDGFLTEREPVVGQMVFIDTETGKTWNKYNSQIYHHKWLWVPDVFGGFDVQESYNWSKEWLSKLPEVASGYPHKWDKQLKKYNII